LIFQYIYVNKARAKITFSFLSVSLMHALSLGSYHSSSEGKIITIQHYFMEIQAAFLREQNY